MWTLFGNTPFLQKMCVYMCIRVCTYSEVALIDREDKVMDFSMFKDSYRMCIPRNGPFFHPQQSSQVDTWRMSIVQRWPLAGYCLSCMSMGSPPAKKEEIMFRCPLGRPHQGPESYQLPCLLWSLLQFPCPGQALWDALKTQTSHKVTGG